MSNAHSSQQTVPSTGDVLAISGGPSVRDTFLPYGRHSIAEEDIQAVVEVLRSEWITTGPKVREFEEAFAAYVGAAHAISFSSGTAALHGAVFAAGLGPGDEAVTTPLTFCATANALVYQGATPLFADVCRDTLNIDPSEVAGRITSRTRAICPIDYGGHPADLDPILELADRHGLVVIEDACHALGAVYRGRRIGTLSHMTVFSFHPVKHLTTGEGGMVTTDDVRLADRLRSFRNHGLDVDVRERQRIGRLHYQMISLGYNYRLTDIGSALGLSQLPRLGDNLERRQAIARQYCAGIRDMDEIIAPTVRPDVTPAWHLFPVQIKLERLKFGRAEVAGALRGENVGVAVHYPLVPTHPYYQERFGFRGGEYPVAEAAYERLISLPMFHAMTDQDVQDVLAGLKKVIAYWRL